MIVFAKILLPLVAISCWYSSLIVATKEGGHDDSMKLKIKSKVLHMMQVHQFFEKEYSKINDYLSGHSDSEDADTNIKIAENWFNSDKKLSSSMLKALEQFTSLAKINDDNSCSEESYNILSTNDKVVRGRSRDIRVGKDPKYERVDKIVRQYCMRHAKRCMVVYPEKYEKLLPSKEGRIDIQRVKEFTDGLINSRLEASNRQGEALKVYGDIDSPTREIDFKGPNDVEALYQTIMVLSGREDSEGGKKRIVKKEIKTQFEKFIKDPCRNYNAILGKDLFTPATFDSIYFHKIDDNAVEYYKAWARFKICKEILGDKGSALLKDLIKRAKQE